MINEYPASQPPNPTKKDGQDLKKEIENTTPRFVSHNQFETSTAKFIQFVIDQIQKNHQTVLIDWCEEQGVGWDEMGNPDTIGISRLESQLWARERVRIAVAVMKELGYKLTTTELEDSFLEEIKNKGFEEIPITVLNFFNTKP